MRAHGYAVIHGGQINVATVSPSEIAAKINWLCAERGVLTLAAVTNEQIERAWEAKRDTARVEPVVITTAPRKGARKVGSGP